MWTGVVNQIKRAGKLTALNTYNYLLFSRDELGKTYSPRVKYSLLDIGFL